MQKTTSSQLTIGVGAIEPAPRLDSGEIDEAKLHDLLERLTGEAFFVPTSDAMPRQCVDGRPRADGTCEPAPNASGGTFSLVMADALSFGKYRRAGGDAAEHAAGLYQNLIDKQYRVGGHDADHHGQDGCGCGAEDKLSDILRFITGRQGNVRETVASMGVTLSDESDKRITDSAKRLLASGYVVSGERLRRAFIDTAGNDSVETLTGGHHEVALSVNTRPGTTLDRAKLAAEFGDAYQVFNLDAPALHTACELIAGSEKERKAMYAASLYYNVAVAAVLAGPSLRVVIR